MRLSRNLRPWLLGSALLACLTPAAWAQRTLDPVEDLRQALKVPVRDVTGNPAELQFRRKNVSEKIQALRTISDLRRALQLPSGTWHADDDRDPDLKAVDFPLRAEVANRFRDGLRAAMKNGPASQLAAAELLEEIGSSIPDSGDTPGGVARPLAPDLAELLKAPDPRVRATAARALGRINPDPTIAAPALGRMVQSEADPALRRAAAQGLAALIQSVTDVAKERLSTLSSPSRGGLVDDDRIQRDLIQAGVAAVNAAGPAATDNDAEVRRLALQVFQLAAIALADLVGEATAEADILPPAGRPWSPAERKQVAEYAQKVQTERDRLLPLATALQGQARGIGRSLSDPSPVLRMAATQALVEAGYARHRLHLRETSIPRQDGDRPPLLNSEDPLLRLIVSNVPALDELLQDPDPRIRLAMLNVLFWLDEGARVAATTLVKALSDPRKFVRWAAVRTLGRTGPVDVPEAVPAIARLLRDQDLNVRQAAAATLERYGPSARAGLPEIIRAINTGDPEMRVAAISTLESIGPDAKPAIPALVAALGHEDARVQRAAAEALGRGNFGEAGRQAEAPLRRAMDSQDPEVRRAASDALLSVRQGLGR